MINVKSVVVGMRDGVTEITGGDMTKGEQTVALAGGVCVAQAAVCIPAWGYVAGAAKAGTVLAGGAGILVTMFKVQAVIGAAALVGAGGKAFGRGFIDGYRHAVNQAKLKGEV